MNFNCDTVTNLDKETQSDFVVLGYFEIGPRSKGSPFRQWRNMLANTGETHTSMYNLCTQPMSLWNCTSCHVSVIEEPRSSRLGCLDNLMCCSIRVPSKCYTIQYNKRCENKVPGRLNIKQFTKGRTTKLETTLWAWKYISIYISTFDPLPPQKDGTLWLRGKTLNLTIAWYAYQIKYIRKPGFNRTTGWKWQQFKAFLKLQLFVILCK